MKKEEIARLAEQTEPELEAAWQQLQEHYQHRKRVWPQQLELNHDHPLSRGLEAGPTEETLVFSREINFQMPYGHLRTLRTLLDCVDAVTSGEVKNQEMAVAMLKDIAYQTRVKFRLTDTE